MNNCELIEKDTRKHKLSPYPTELKIPNTRGNF